MRVFLAVPTRRAGDEGRWLAGCRAEVESLCVDLLLLSSPVVKFLFAVTVKKLTFAPSIHSVLSCKCGEKVGRGILMRGVVFSWQLDRGGGWRAVISNP